MLEHTIGRELLITQFCAFSNIHNVLARLPVTTAQGALYELIGCAAHTTVNVYKRIKCVFCSYTKINTRRKRLCIYDSLYPCPRLVNVCEVHFLSFSV